MKKIIEMIDGGLKCLQSCTPIVDLGVRLYVGMVFWKSGIVKYASIDSTIWLFTHEYHVPILSPIVAAYLSTAAELGFSALLMLGLFGRFSALALFVVNVVAVISYPNLHDTGIQWHMIWGLLLLVTLFHGPGKLSLDYWIWKKIKKRYPV